jgi:3-phytase
VETQTFPGGGTFDDGDIADDSAIWINRSDPARSAVVADDKDEVNGGIAVYDMRGMIVQFRHEGQIGNVDLREGFPLGGRNVVLVGANNRSSNTIMFWELEPATRRLTPITARSIGTVSPNYGFCMYKSPSNGRFYAYVSQAGGGQLEQYELFDAGGSVDATKVRSVDVGSQAEGCVADDELARLYVGEEDVAIWRYGAEPSSGSDRTPVDHVGGHVVADVEGLTLVYGAGGAGYLMASSQGDSTIAVYERTGGNAFVKRFPIAGSHGADAVSGTDGIDASRLTQGQPVLVDLAIGENGVLTLLRGITSDLGIGGANDGHQRLRAASRRRLSGRTSRRGNFRRRAVARRVPANIAFRAAGRPGEISSPKNTALRVWRQSDAKPERHHAKSQPDRPFALSAWRGGARSDL